MEGDVGAGTGGGREREAWRGGPNSGGGGGRGAEPCGAGGDGNEGRARGRGRSPGERTNEGWGRGRSGASGAGRGRGPGVGGVARAGPGSGAWAPGRVPAPRVAAWGASRTRGSTVTMTGRAPPLLQRAAGRWAPRGSRRPEGERWVSPRASRRPRRHWSRGRGAGGGRRGGAAPVRRPREARARPRPTCVASGPAAEGKPRALSAPQGWGAAEAAPTLPEAAGGGARRAGQAAG